MKLVSLRHLALASAVLLSASALAQTAPPPPPDQDKDDQSSRGVGDIVITSMRVQGGGAQDVSHFRTIADTVGMPRPESLTAEGLLNEYDLTLPAAAGCKQVLCVVTETMPANLSARPGDKQFVGLGFASNIDEAKWKRAPLDLVAVVDKSGSMNGVPLARVRASLRQIVGQMRPGDRISIVLYGDTSAVYLKPTDVGDGRDDILRAIDQIKSAGSTNMEEGLRVGYDTAFAEAKTFKGNVRVMLFTDEQPNVGATDADSFSGMAEEASRRGIGLTTIGVGVQFDQTLASQVSAARGGNLFFIGSDADVKAVFAKRLDTMVSELAYDMHLTIKPAPGWKISGVFGVPDGTMEDAPDGAVSLTVPTVFLSTNGGGIFVTLAKSGDRADLPAAAAPPGTTLADISLDYRLRDGNQLVSSNVAATVAPGPASAPLRTAFVLVDEFVSLRDATTAYHQRNDAKGAFATLTALKARITGSGLPGLEKEDKLVTTLLGQAAFYAGYTGEMPKTIRHLAVIGTWEITSAEGFADLARGDRLEFTDERDMYTYRQKAGLDNVDDSERYEINENAIRLVDSKLIMKYTVVGDRMTMTMSDSDGRAVINLRRVPDTDS